MRRPNLVELMEGSTQGFGKKPAAQPDKSCLQPNPLAVPEQLPLPVRVSKKRGANPASSAKAKPKKAKAVAEELTDELRTVQDRDPVHSEQARSAGTGLIVSNYAQGAERRARSSAAHRPY